MSPDPACNYTDTRSSQPNQVGGTPDLSYLLVSTSFSFSSPVSLFLVHNSTIIAEHKVKSSLSISPCHDHELTPSTAYTEYSIHRVQHKPSTAYTEYSTLCTAYTAYCIIPRLTFSHSRPVSQLSADHVVLDSLHSHDSELTNE
jgi:hypothetical protein